MGIKIAKIVLVTAAVYFGMKFIFPIVLPFLAALLLARILYPAARWIEQKTGLKKTGARCAAYVLFLAATGLLAAGLLYLCYRMGSNCLPHLDGFLKGAEQMVGTCCEKLEGWSGYGMEEIRETINQGTAKIAEGAIGYSKNAGFYMAGLLAKIFVAMIAAYLMLLDYEGIIRSFNKTQAGKYTMRLMHDVKTACGAYLKAQLLIMGIVTSVCIAGLYLLKTPYAFWAGFAVGVCDALPFIGTGTVFVPWALVETVFGGYQKAVGYLLIYFVCSCIRQFLEPKLVGNRLGVPPLAVLMSIYIGVQVYGGAGVVLGPLSALLILRVCRELL